MWGWFTGWGKTSPVSRRLFFTASAMASAIPCRAPSGTLARCWLAVPPADEVEAISWPVLAGEALLDVVCSQPSRQRLRLETRVRYALLTAGLFPFGGILGGGRSGLITDLTLCAQNDAQKKTDPT